MARRYDLIVLGGGAAGFSAVVKYSEVTGGGRSVAMVNKGRLGGTCVNVGCVPSKALIEAAKKARLTGAPPDFAALMSGIKSLVDGVRREKYERVLARLGNVDFYDGEASFESPSTIIVRSGDGVVRLEGGNVIISTGSRPSVPRVEGIEDVTFYTSDTIWGVRGKPSRMLVIGAGAVGLEFAQSFARLGTEVAVVEVLERPLPGTEPEVSLGLTNALEREGVKLYLRSRVSRLRERRSVVEAEITGPQGPRTEEYDIVLVATGRRPNTDGLNLGRCGVETNEKGFISVSRDLRTSNPRVYAAGDVAATPKPALLETLAAREGAVAATNIALGERRGVDYLSAPVVVFTDPELAYVGLNEASVVREVGACSCRIARFSTTARSRILGYEDGLAKVVVDPRTRVIKGVHVLAPNASEFIVWASMAIRHGYKLEDLIDTIHVFPTSSEVVKLAAQSFLRDVESAPCCVE